MESKVVVRGQRPRVVATYQATNHGLGMGLVVGEIVYKVMEGEEGARKEEVWETETDSSQVSRNVPQSLSVKIHGE